MKAKIYLLKEPTGNYKIGFTKRKVEQRIKELETGNPGHFEIVHVFETKHNRKIETALHNLYKHKHVNREYYNLDESDVDIFLERCSNIEKGYDALVSFNNKFI